MSKKTNLIIGAAATVAATSLLVGCNLYGKEKYKVIFETNGGEPLAPVEVEWGVEYKVDVTPTKIGYSFKGWYFDAGLTNPVTEDIIIEGDVSLFAKWEINQYTITFDTNGGNEMTSIKANYNTELKLDDPVKRGYEFQGWYIDEDLKEKFDDKIPGEDITVYAKWKECKLSIIFNANASDVTGEMGKPTFNTEDEKLNLPESTYVREGYIFKGWSRTPNGIVEFENKANISSLLDESKEVTLYAVWEAKEYEIHFVSNGLAYGEDIKVKYDQNIVLPQTNPTKDGHEFLGWGQYKLTTDSVFAENKVYYTYDLTSKIYSVSDVTIGEAINANTYYEATVFTTTNKMPNGNLQLNAIWSKNSYTISFNTNGAGTLNSITQPFNSSIVLPSNLSKTGYTFAGWFKDEGLTIRFDSTSMPLNGATLYAKWEANKYSIYFDANLGNGTTTKVDATYDVETTLTTNGFSKVGYSFVGWNTKADGSGTSYTDGQTIKNLLSENGASLTLYAVWEANTNTKYVVNIYRRTLEGTLERLQSYEDSGVSDTEVTLSLMDFEGFITPTNQNIFVKADGSATIDVVYERQSYKVIFTATHPDTHESITSSDIDVKYEGSIIFPSSYNIKNYSLVWKYDGEVVNADTKVTEDMTLVAEYIRIEKTIVIHSEGQQNVEIPNVDAGINVLTLLSEQPSKVGYSFGGWYLDSNFETELTSTYVMPEDNLDIYVKWNINQYTISFDSGVTSITQNYGTSVTLPTPSKTGYIFGGWLRNGQPYSVTTMPAEDGISLTAKWDPITYSIVFDSNGGSGTTSSINNVKYDTKVNLSSNGFERKGYSFLGWSTSKTDTSNLLLNTQEVENLTSENDGVVTLYAVWEINTYTYNFIVVDNEGNTVETLSSQSLHYDVQVTIPNTNKQDEYPTSYTFDGWYSDASCTSKVDVDKNAFTTNSSNVVNYYCKYSTESYIVQFRNGNDGIIFETTSEGDINKNDLSVVQKKFYNYIQETYYKDILAYDFIYEALSDAAKLTGADTSKIQLVDIYFIFCLELDFTEGNFKDLPVFPGFKNYDLPTKIAYMNQGTGGLVSVENATYICNLFNGRFDYSNSKDITLIQKILSASDMTTMEVAMQAVSLERTNLYTDKKNGYSYNDYLHNAFCPVREGYIFNGWDIIIDEVNNIKIVDATWVKKLETPINVKVQSTTKNSVIYSWYPVDGATSYTVSYTVKQGDTIVRENVIDTTQYLSYEVEGLVKENTNDENYTVEFKVKANNPSGSTSNRIELKDEDAFDTSAVKVIESREIDSDYSNTVSYVHVVIEATEFDEADIGPNYYRDKNNKIFYFFESNYYVFNGIDNIEILEGNQYAYYENGELHINQGSVGQTIRLEITPKNQEPIEYTAYIQPKITSISFGNNLNSYLDVKAGKGKYLSKEEVKYLVGAATNDKDMNHNGYSYEDEITEKTYYNGFKFDINVDTISGNTYTADSFTKDQFQLAYKFYDLSNPLNTDSNRENDVITTPQDLYVRDVENDVLYFLKDSGQYRVDISYKTDGYYLTEDKSPIANKKYYDANGNEITNVGSSFVPGTEYYEHYVSIGLQNNIKNDSASNSKFNLSFTINLDDSINVFDSKALRTAHSDPDVSNISIHANIKANFATDQIIQEDYFNKKMPKFDSSDWFGTYDGNIDVKEGTAVFSNEEGLSLKIWAKGNGDRAIRAKDGNLYHYVGDGGEYSLVEAEWVNNWENGQFVAFNDDVDLFYDRPEVLKSWGFKTNAIYQREFNNSPTGLTVNGNYFTVDGSDAPYVKSDQNSSKTGAYKIQNTRAIIFETTKGDTTYNNLKVIGNTQNYSSSLTGSTASSMSIEEYMERTSGGLLGFKTYSISLDAESAYGANKNVNFNNVIIENTYVGISSYRKVSIDVNYTLIDNSWSNSIVCWNTNNTTIRNSVLSNSGGSAIHMNDGWFAHDASGNRIDSMSHPDYGTITCNPSLNIDFTTTTISNMVAGEEPWFKQHGMEVAALNLKSGLESLANNFGKTVIQIVKDPVTLRDSEKMNFIAVGMTDSDVASSAAKEDQGYELTLQGFIPLKDGGITYQNIPVHGSSTDTFTIYTNGTKFYVEYVTYLIGSPVEILVEMVDM